MAHGFPDIGSRDTQRYALAIISFYEYSVNILSWSSGLRTDVWQRDYYTRLRDRIPGSVQKWKDHVQTLELIMKPLTNVIE